MTDDEVESISLPDVLPVLPLRETILYPDVASRIVVAHPGPLRLVTDVLRGNRLAALVAQKHPENVPPHPEDLYRTGTAALMQEIGGTDGAIGVAIRGLARIHLLDFTQTEPYLVARVERAHDADEDGVEVEALMRTAKDLFRAFVPIAAELPNELIAAAEQVTEPRQLSFLIASAVPLPMSTRQEILESDRSSARLKRLIETLQHELAVRQLSQRITTETVEEIGKAQREHILRKQMESIQRELGDADSGRAELKELRDKLGQLSLSDEARKEASHELDRLDHMPDSSPEYGMVRTYVDWLLKLPWGKLTGQRIDVDRARQVLDEDHYDLDKIKDRILDYLAVKRLREERRAELERKGDGKAADARGQATKARTEPILCFLGPPGVGKTSLGQSIARALGRAFVHQSLGGVQDEAEIRGHRRTYIGSMPGRIIQALARAGAADTVFVLDEIDKIRVGFHGDPSAALLEVLDPTQNHAFTDTYLGVSFDLSQVLFICTANTTESIPPALFDRMEVLTLAGYTEREKLEIARRFLLPNQRVANGLREGEVFLPDETLLSVIRRYTREAGVRNLEREIGTILRKAARRITQHGSVPIAVAPADLRAYLGPEHFFDEVAERIDRPGIAAGLAWTPAGGEVMFVEAAMVEGTEDRLILTGMLGDVMRESAEAALTYLRAHAEALGIAPRKLQDRRVVHVHVPAGGVPKDGPSAGVTILVALASHALGRHVKPGVAMTGEITLRGKVLPIGGVKEKVLAAHRAGLKTVMLPRRNQGDLEDVPQEVREACRFVLVESVDEVLDEALGVARESLEEEDATPAVVPPARPTLHRSGV